MAQPSPGTGDQFNPTWITAVVALLALLRPEVTRLTGRLFRRGRLRVIQTGKIEIGFSALGPTVGVLGALHAYERTFFVESLAVTIVRLKDSATHRFDWAFVRPFTPFDPAASQASQATLPVPFDLPTGQPKPFSCVFADPIVQNELEPVQQRLQADLSQFLMQPMQTQQGDLQPFPVDQFIKSGKSAAHSSEIQNLFYWNAGTHRLSLKVNTSDPVCTYIHTCEFDLTQREVDNIRFNITNIIRLWGGAQVPQWNFAHVKCLTIQ